MNSSTLTGIESAQAIGMVGCLRRAGVFIHLKGGKKLAGGGAQRNHRNAHEERQHPSVGARDVARISRATFGAHDLFADDPVVPLVPRCTTG